MNNMRMMYQTRCVGCGGITTKQYAKAHNGCCKQCTEPGTGTSAAERRNATIIDHGYDAYAREEGHHDQGDR